MARRRRGRAIDGIVLLDKPAGMTSNAALQRVKRLFDAQKAGHTGSLDPLATGLLPICLGKATRVSAFLLDSDKGYRVRARLGQRTDTCDADGKVIAERDWQWVGEGDLDDAIARFRGEVEQVPPMYSALKQDGRRLYELAREGIEVERKARRIHFHKIERQAFEPPEFELEVLCSKGGYIRSLIDDIGEALGCGAHVTALRRTVVMPYDHPEMVTLEMLAKLQETSMEALDRVILPTDSALTALPAIRLDADSAHYVCHGQAVFVPRAPTAGLVRLYAADDLFLGIGEVADDGRVAPRRLMVAA